MHTKQLRKSIFVSVCDNQSKRYAGPCDCCVYIGSKKKKSPCMKGENKYFSCSANSLSSVSGKMVVKLGNFLGTEAKYLTH